MTVDIALLDADGVAAVRGELELLLEACVVAGASIGFVLPLAAGEINRYWSGVIRSVAAGEKRLLVARLHGTLVGTVQLALEPRANGAHRAEVQKLLVSPGARRNGVGEALVRAAEAEALAGGRTLMVLDTRVDDDAQRLYTRLGYQLAGVIPHYARSPDGRTLDGSAFMYKRLQQQQHVVHGNGGTSG